MHCPSRRCHLLLARVLLGVLPEWRRLGVRLLLLLLLQLLAGLPCRPFSPGRPLQHRWGSAGLWSSRSCTTLHCTALHCTVTDDCQTLTLTACHTLGGDDDNTRTDRPREPVRVARLPPVACTCISISQHTATNCNALHSHTPFAATNTRARPLWSNTT